MYLSDGSHGTACEAKAAFGWLTLSLSPSFAWYQYIVLQHWVEHLKHCLSEMKDGGRKIVEVMSCHVL